MIANDTGDENLLIKFGSNNYPVVVSLSEYKGIPTIDIRRYYLERDSAKLKPTKKGISLQLKNFGVLLDVLLENREPIIEWLVTGGDDHLRNARETLMARSMAEEDAKRAAHDQKTNISSWRAPSFFQVKAQGACDVITFNERHELTKKLEDFTASQKDDAMQLLSDILISYVRAKNLFDAPDDAALFNSIEYEWGLILNNYLKAR